MRCQQFETIVSDLASEKLMEASLRNHALAHVQVCRRCASRLANERTLTKALRATADAEHTAAPDRVKAMLLEAFGQPRADLQPSAIASPRRFSRWAIAAAAILALVAIPVASWLLSANQPSQPVAVRDSSQEPPAKDLQGSTPSSSAVEAQPGVLVNDDHQPATARKDVGSRSADRRAVARARATEKTPRGEAVTDFIPLTYLSNATAMGSGTVVRVNISRSTLLALGLPMNVNRGSEMIKADLVVSDDGLARAIRIVY
jgi:hypothetical protein